MSDHTPATTTEHMQIIDAQIHLWESADAPPHHWRAPFTIERAIQEMNEAGVDRAINCPAIWDDTANDYAVRAALTNPDRFATMGWFPLDRPGGGDSLVDEWMAKPGMLGLRFVLFAPHAGELIASGALDWLWKAADRRRLPIALMVMPQDLPIIGDVAARHPGMRLMLDHLAISPFEKLPQAAAHLPALLDLAHLSNVAVKATGIPSMATDDYPYRSTHDVLRRTFDAFGPERMFWGTDITRLPTTWGESITMFTNELPWLTGRDLELVMGKAVADWVGWA